MQSKFTILSRSLVIVLYYFTASRTILVFWWGFSLIKPDLHQSLHQVYQWDQIGYLLIVRERFSMSWIKNDCHYSCVSGKTNTQGSHSNFQKISYEIVTFFAKKLWNIMKILRKIMTKSCSKRNEMLYLQCFLVTQQMGF